MSIEAIAWAFKQPISPAAKKFVLVALADNADDYGICFPSYRHIEEKTGISRRTIIDHCKAHVKEGVIEKAPRMRGNGSDTSNAYRLPIMDGCIDDHPLSPLFKSGGVQISHPPGADFAPQSADFAPPEPSYNRQLTEKEKNALTREEFLREIDKGFNENAFQEWEHLTETEIKQAAEACLDFYGAKGEWPAGAPVYVLRHWIRGGIKKGKIRAQPKEEARQEVQAAEPENPIQDWHKRIERIVGEQAFRSWFRPVYWDGDKELCAPSAFHADYLRQNFIQDIEQVLGGFEIVHKPYQPQKEKELEHA